MHLSQKVVKRVDCRLVYHRKGLVCCGFKADFEKVVVLVFFKRVKRLPDRLVELVQPAGLDALALASPLPDPVPPVQAKDPARKFLPRDAFKVLSPSCHGVPLFPWLLYAGRIYGEHEPQVDGLAANEFAVPVGPAPYHKPDLAIGQPPADAD